MKVPQLSGLMACALLCVSPVDAAAAKCRPTASQPALPSKPSCTNYITNKFFTSASGWTFSGNAGQSSNCDGVSTCGQINANEGPASFSQTFETVPGFQYWASFGYMYTTSVSAADEATCEIISGGSTIASVNVPFRTENSYYGKGFYFTPPTARTATLKCTTTSAATGLVDFTQMDVTWDQCFG
ncbi:hypothetical protein SBRCBS47491_001572 [Sporothrix bragantina]|uniref:Secreted protein n=1 Tax=Sporothrix bragantina TaxID=671064 RepID=A0ABP0AZZ7_9PEZI